MGRVPVETTKS